MYQYNSLRNSNVLNSFENQNSDRVHLYIDGLHGKTIFLGKYCSFY
jgi:hypothetical protein